MIRVLIVDDQMIVCEGLRVVLNSSPQLQVVGMAYDGIQALEKVAELQPDVVLMDLKMPIMNGIGATRAIKEQYTHVAVLALTTYDDEEWLIDVVRAGANGYLLKEASREELVAAIVETAKGRTHVDPTVAGKLFTYIRQGHNTSHGSTLAQNFSKREREVLQLLANGLNNAEIGERLSLAEGTVRNHVTNILAKLEVTDRAQATALAWRYGLVEPSL